MEDRWAKRCLCLDHTVAALLAGSYDADLTFVPDGCQQAPGAEKRDRRRRPFLKISSRNLAHRSHCPDTGFAEIGAQGAHLNTTSPPTRLLARIEGSRSRPITSEPPVIRQPSLP